MPDQKLSQLASVTPAAGDLLYLVDVSDPTDGPAGSSKKAAVGDVVAMVSLTVSDTTALGTLTAVTNPLFLLGSQAGPTPGFVRRVTPGAGTGGGLSLLLAADRAAVLALLGTGTANATTFLRGDGTWANELGGGLTLNGALITQDNDIQCGGGTVFALAYEGSGESLLSLNASALTTGTVPTARLGTGTANATTFLRGDGTWAAVAAGGMAIGGAIAGGATAGRVLYVGAGPTLAEDNGAVSLTVGPRTVQGVLTVRQTGGTAGTDEVQHYHDGSEGVRRGYDGPLVDVSANGVHAFRRGGAPTFDIVQILSTSVIGGISVGYDGAIALRNGAPGSLTSGNTAFFYQNTLRLNSTGFVGFTSTSDANATMDTGVARGAAKVVSLTDAGVGGGTLRSVPITPAQITADQNNYAPGVARYYRLSSDASRIITGLSVSQVDGQECEIWNVGSQNIDLAHQSASSTAANRFICPGAAAVSLNADEVALLRYDATTSRWRVRKV